MFKDNFKWFEDHKNELFSKYTNKAIIIRNNEIVEVCDTCNEAQELAKSKYGFDGTWIVKSCDPNRKAIDLPNYPYIWGMIREPNPIYRVEKVAS